MNDPSVPDFPATRPSLNTLYLDNGAWKVGDYARDFNDVVWQLANDGDGVFYWQCGPHPHAYVAAWIKGGDKGPVLPIQKVTLVPYEDQWSDAGRPISFRDAMHMAISIYANVKIPGQPENTANAIIETAKKIMATDRAGNK